MNRHVLLCAIGLVACSHDAARPPAVSRDTVVFAAPAAAVHGSCAPPASSVVKKDSVLYLKFANGDTLSLHDEPPGDGQTEYKTTSYVGSIGYHVVELVMWGGPSHWYVAYNGCDGKKLVIDNVPVVSPDSLRFVTVGYGTPLKKLVKRVQVFSRVGANEFGVDWDFELGIWNNGKPPLDWGPVNPRWTGAASLKFDRADSTGKIIGTAIAERDAGGWHFSVAQ